MANSVTDRIKTALGLNRKAKVKSDALDAQKKLATTRGYGDLTSQIISL